jgi:predicted RecA/RadA family phage recombinase
MRNMIFDEDENIVNITAPSNVTAGDFVQLGRIRGVAMTTQLSGEQVALKVKGTFDITKLGSEAFASVGLPVYVVLSGDGVKTATTANAALNVLIGVSMAVSAAAPGTVRVRLMPTASNVGASTVA